MKETEKNWHEISKHCIKKLILCWDTFERKSVIERLCDVLSKDGSYKFRRVDHSYEIIVQDLILKEDFRIDAVSTNQWSWLDRVNGLEFNEVVATKAGWGNMEDKEKFPALLSRKRKSKTILSANSLSFLLRNKGNVLKEMHGFGDLWETGGSMSPDFDFPPSLFTRGMMSYFENITKPTPEEFLMALMMEGVSGSTEREKKAIEAAQLHVESKGN